MNQIPSIHLQIACLRKEKGVTQEEMAQYLGVSYQAVSKWETGASYPDITMLPAIAQYFGVRVDTILGLQPAMPKIEDAYEILKQLFCSVSKEKLYPLARNLLAVIFEGIATKGWKEYVPWEIRNRLKDDGYSGWGFAANIEPEGFSFMLGGMTIIADMKEVNLPQIRHSAAVSNMFNVLSDIKLLKILISLVNNYKGHEDDNYFTLEQVCEMTGLDVSTAENCMNRLLAENWVVREFSSNGEKLHYRLMLGRIFLPIFLLAKTIACDLKP